jgi:putative Mg2+ transporter-C (MgtC) family protein
MDRWTTIETVSLPELLLRVGLALLFGFVIGYERDSKNKPIDFRAYMIVAVTTCVIAVLGQELYENVLADEYTNLDLGKIISGTLTGIGFLGAGAIMKVGGRDDQDDAQIVGTATGASVWASGGIGLCLGFGMYLLALVGFGAIALILFIGGMFVGKVNANGNEEHDDYRRPDNPR